MLQPREGEMNYKNIEELSFYYMFLASCLPIQQYDILKERWTKLGGVKYMPWWKFVGENVNIHITPQIPVITRYSFDTESTVNMFYSEENAKKFLIESFNSEVEHDKENGYASECKIDKNQKHATIITKFEDKQDTTEFTIGKMYND